MFESRALSRAEADTLVSTNRNIEVMIGKFPILGLPLMSLKLDADEP